MGIFIKTNDTTPETDDIFDNTYLENLEIPEGYDDFWRVGYDGGYLYTKINNKLYMFKTEASGSSYPGHYQLENFYGIYDLSTQDWSFYEYGLLPTLCQPYKSLYLASDSNRIYFCFNGDVTSNPSTGGSEYKKYDHHFYGLDLDNYGVIDYTNKIGRTRVGTNNTTIFVSLDAIEQWNIKNFSSDSILLNGFAVTYRSSNVYNPGIGVIQQKLTLLPNSQESTISSYGSVGGGVHPKVSWMYPHKLYNDGLEVWMNDLYIYVKKDGITITNPLPSTWKQGEYPKDVEYNILTSGTFLRDQLHLFYYDGIASPHQGISNYNYAFKSNDSNSEKYIWLEGDKSKVDNIYLDTYQTQTLYYTFEHNNELYSISRSYNGSTSTGHFRKIYSIGEQTFSDGTHGKIKGIWVKVKKMVQDANGNYEVIEEPKRVTKMWVKTGNSYEKILW